MKILSFDQAANVSGWSFWKDEYGPTEWGIIEPKPRSLRDGARLTSLRYQFKELIEKYDPNIVLIENPVGGEEDKSAGPENNWKTMQTLCQVQGVLMQVINELDKNIDIISPSSWQNTCGIHKRFRAERKAGAVEFVKRYYGMDTDVVAQDVVDSICIAHHYVESNKQRRSAF